VVGTIWQIFCRGDIGIAGRAIHALGVDYNYTANATDAWLTVLRTAQPRFEFTDPPFRHSLPMTLAFAATASRPVAVLTGPLHPAEAQITPIRRQPMADLYDMARVSIEGRPLTATAALSWNGDLPRELQQILFDTADRSNDNQPSAAAS